ncbi:hypothetical protein D3C80_709480 [compost metagenome]
MELAGRDRDGDDIADQADLGISASVAENIHFMVVGKAYSSPSLGQEPNDVRNHRDGI